MAGTILQIPLRRMLTSGTEFGRKLVVPRLAFYSTLRDVRKGDLSMRYVVLSVGASKYHEISSLFPLLGREKTNSGQI